MSRDGGGHRARKKVASRQRLIECAASLFTERGYDATTMDDIGACADVSRATVFNYFPRKEDLVLAWFDARRDELAVGTRAGDAVDRLRDTFRTVAGIFETDPATGRAMLRAWLRAGGPLFTPSSPTEVMLADIVRDGQAQGGIGRDVDPAGAGRLLFDAYSGVLYRWVSSPDGEVSLEDELTATLDLVLTGLRTIA